MNFQKFSPTLVSFAIVATMAPFLEPYAYSFETKTAEVEQTYTIQADSESDFTKKFLDITGNKSQYPEDCKQVGVKCTSENLVVEVKIKRQVRYNAVPAINSPHINGEILCENFPRISDQNSEALNTNIAQAALWLRGLLQSEVTNNEVVNITGRLGQKTQEAFLLFQIIKNINNESSRNPGKVTFAELNKMIERMCDPHYLLNNWEPPTLNNVADKYTVSKNKQTELESLRFTKRLLEEQGKKYKIAPKPEIQNDFVPPLIDVTGKIQFVVPNNK